MSEEGEEFFDQEEWEELLRWIDSLTLSEVKHLKEYFEQFSKQKQ